MVSTGPRDVASVRVETIKVADALTVCAAACAGLGIWIAGNVACREGAISLIA